AMYTRPTTHEHTHTHITSLVFNYGMSDQRPIRSKSTSTHPLPPIPPHITINAFTHKHTHTQPHTHTYTHTHTPILTQRLTSGILIEEKTLFVKNKHRLQSVKICHQTRSAWCDMFYLIQCENSSVMVVTDKGKKEGERA